MAARSNWNHSAARNGRTYRYPIRQLRHDPPWASVPTQRNRPSAKRLAKQRRLDRQAAESDLPEDFEFWPQPDHIVHYRKPIKYIASWDVEVPAGADHGSLDLQARHSGQIPVNAVIDSLHDLYPMAQQPELKGTITVVEVAGKDNEVIPPMDIQIRQALRGLIGRKDRTMQTKARNEVSVSLTVDGGDHESVHQHSFSHVQKHGDLASDRVKAYLAEHFPADRYPRGQRWQVHDQRYGSGRPADRPVPRRCKYATHDAAHGGHDHQAVACQRRDAP